MKDVLKNWDLVLLFEEFRSSVALICIFLEISEKDCCLPFINRRRSESFPIPSLSASDIKYFNKVNWRDRILYDQAKRIFEKLLVCSRKEVDQYLSNMQVCANTSGVKINSASEVFTR